MFRLIDQLGLVKRGDRLLDIGCGPGAMVSGLLHRAGRAGSYVGFDVHRPSIEWCRRLYREDARCRFELARLASPYATPGGGPVKNYSSRSTTVRLIGLATVTFGGSAGRGC